MMFFPMLTSSKYNTNVEHSCTCRSAFFSPSKGTQSNYCLFLHVLLSSEVEIMCFEGIQRIVNERFLVGHLWELPPPTWWYPHRLP